MSKIDYKCNHLITFCTKYKKEILNQDVQKGLRDFFKDECENKGYTLSELKFTPYSVTMVISFPPTESIQLVISRLKRGCIEIIKNISPEIKTKLPNVWTKQYHVQTIGDINNKSIEEFIKSQNTRNETRKK